MKKFGFSLLAAGLLASVSATAGVSRDLAYPTGAQTADQIADQVYFVNHFYALKNFGIGKKGKTITAIISRSKGKEPITLTVERYLNNDYSDGVTAAKDIAIFKSFL